ncbi:MAG: hypothetical protein Q8R88_12390 [Desulfoprunum sp.]|nr:hypothetical protein [Desulfoprunum sp.]
MHGDLVLRKQVELAALQSSDSKTRRLFILADGKKSLEQLYQLCGFNEAQGASIVEALMGVGAIGVVGNTAQDPGQGVVISDDIVKKIVGEMANYVGPIATILVQRNARSGQVVTHEELNQIFVTLAENIEGDEDKQQFLAKVSGII